MKFTDAATISGTRTTKDGYLVTEVFAVRTGIQLYAGSEVGLVDTEVVRVYRPEDEVRAPLSLATFSHAPVTMGHPTVAVTKDNWASLSKGEVSTEATWDGNKIKLPLIVKDAGAIAAIGEGTRELSAGYTCELEFVDGFTPEGEPYDAIQRNIRVNHLAIVPKGRAGDACRIGDDATNWGIQPCSPQSKLKDHDMTMLTVVLGDQAAQVAVADAPKVEKFKSDTAAALADMEKSYKAKEAEKDEEIGKLKAENKKMGDAALTPDKLTQLIADRVSLETTVSSIAPDVKAAGVSDADLRKAAVAAVYGDDMAADASEGEISGMFKALAKDAATAPKHDTFADARRKGITQPMNDAWGAFVPAKEA